MPFLVCQRNAEWRHHISSRSIGIGTLEEHGIGVRIHPLPSGIGLKARQHRRVGRNNEEVGRT
jgi:hypothetical protein